MEGRQQLEIIQTLLKNLVYVQSDSQIKSTLDQTTTYINSMNLAKYCEYQGAYKDHLAVLRTEKRKVPKQEGTDKNRPPIPSMWSGCMKKRNLLNISNLTCRVHSARLVSTSMRSTTQIFIIPSSCRARTQRASWSSSWPWTLPTSSRSMSSGTACLVLDTGRALDGDDNEDAETWIDSSK